MKKLLLTSFFCIVAICSFATEFSNPAIQEKIDRWNRINQIYGKDLVRWAQAIVDSSAYQLDSEGGIMSEYVIQASDTLDIERVKEITIDYIHKYFNINNATHSDIVSGTTENSIYFKGILQEISYYPLIMDYIRYDANIIFNFKFKADRLKITIQIPKMTWVTLGTRYERPMNALVPLGQNSKYNRQDKERDARALINSISKAISYPLYYLNFLNSQYNISFSEDDTW